MSSSLVILTHNKGKLIGRTKIKKKNISDIKKIYIKGLKSKLYVFKGKRLRATLSCG